MKVRYTVTLADFVAYSLYLNKKSGAGRTGYLMVLLGFPTLCVGGAMKLLQVDHEILACVLAAFAIFWLVVFPPRYRAALARNTRAFVKKLGARGIIGERTLIFSEELIIAISETFRMEVRWENMTSVEVVGDTTYIFISGISGLILPRHGFESEVEYEAARDFALRKLEGHVPM